jgi:hypothetical protein
MSDLKVDMLLEYNIHSLLSNLNYRPKSVEIKNNNGYSIKYNYSMLDIRYIVHYINVLHSKGGGLVTVTIYRPTYYEQISLRIMIELEYKNYYMLDYLSKKYVKFASSDALTIRLFLLGQIGLLEDIRILLYHILVNLYVAL